MKALRLVPLLAALSGCHGAPPAKPLLAIAATGDIWGQVEPCG